LVGIGGGFGRLVISWLPNPLNSDQRITGYKVSWDTPTRLVQSAIDGVSATETRYTTDPIDLSVEYGVLVWAYSELGDGLPAKAEWTPEGKILPSGAHKREGGRGEGGGRERGREGGGRERGREGWGRERGGREGGGREGESVNVVVF
jgi:hypothetical protein